MRTAFAIFARILYSRAVYDILGYIFEIYRKAVFKQEEMKL